MSVTLDAAFTFSIMITRDHLDDAFDANIVRVAIPGPVAAVRALGLFARAERRIRLTVAKRAGPAGAVQSILVSQVRGDWRLGRLFGVHWRLESSGRV